MMQKVAGRSNPGLAVRRLENPAVNGYFFFINQGMIRQRKVRDGPRLSSAMPIIQ